MSCHSVIKSCNDHKCKSKKIKPVFSTSNTDYQNLTIEAIPGGNITSTPIVASFNANIDTLSTFNGSVNEYTIPCSGNYQINVSLNYINTKTSEFVVTQTPVITCILMKNNSPIFNQYGQVECPITNSIPKKNGLSLSIINYFNKNDKVNVKVSLTNVSPFSNEEIKIDSIYFV
jgi:hypothetical protein